MTQIDKIKEAGGKYAPGNGIALQCFEVGATSPEAKEYWQQKHDEEMEGFINWKEENYTMVSKNKDGNVEFVSWIDFQNTPPAKWEYVLFSDLLSISTGNKQKNNIMETKREVFKCKKCNAGVIQVKHISWTEVLEINIKKCTTCKYQYGLKEIYKDKLEPTGEQTTKGK